MEYFHTQTWSLVLLASFAACLSAQTTEEYIERAQVFAAKNDHAKALKEYKKITNPGHDTLFNMGSSAYALKKYGKALWYWRKAERQPNWSSRVKLFENIQKVQKRLAPPIKGKPHFYDPVLSWLHIARNFAYSLLVSLPMIGLQLIFLILWFALSYFSRNKRIAQNGGKNAVLLGATLAIAVMLGARYFADRRTWAVVTQNNTSLRSGPGTQYPELGKLPEGGEVAIYDARSNYYKVEFNHLRGWANDKKIFSITT